MFPGLYYEIGPQKALSISTADTLLWEQGTIPSGSRVKAVSFVMTGTAHDLDSIASMKFMRNGTDFINLANDLQVQAFVDSLGKKTVATSAVRFTIPFQNIYGWPIQHGMWAAPASEALSIQIITDGTGSGAGTITPIFHLDESAPANEYPVLISQQLAAGTPSNTDFHVGASGQILHGFIVDETNVTTLGFNYLGKDVWPTGMTPAMLNEIQELWQGTTVTTNRAIFLSRPLPVVPGQTKLKVTGSGAVGQVIPILTQPY